MTSLFPGQMPTSAEDMDFLDGMGEDVLATMHLAEIATPTTTLPEVVQRVGAQNKSTLEQILNAIGSEDWTN